MHERVLYLFLQLLLFLLLAVTPVRGGRSVLGSDVLPHHLHNVLVPDLVRQRLLQTGPPRLLLPNRLHNIPKLHLLLLGLSLLLRERADSEVFLWLVQIGQRDDIGLACRVKRIEVDSTTHHLLLVNWQRRNALLLFSLAAMIRYVSDIAALVVVRLPAKQFGQVDRSAAVWLRDSGLSVQSAYTDVDASLDGGPILLHADAAVGGNERE